MGPDGFDVRLDGTPVGESRAVDTAHHPHLWQRDEIAITLQPSAEHLIEIRSPEELRSAIEFASIALDSAGDPPHRPLCYESILTAERYEEATGVPGVRVDRPHLCVFAPRVHAQIAERLADFMEGTYRKAAELVGGDAVFRFSVEFYPSGHSRGWGGVSGGGTIGYPLEPLERFERLGTRDVRGFVGFTEEMCHVFVNQMGCGGTHEALGRALQEEVIRRVVSSDVADAFWLPEHRQWAETHVAYLAADRQNPDPSSYPWNVLYTRILNDVFLQLRQEYGPDLWTDFFQEIREQDFPLHRAQETERMGVYADLSSELLRRDMRSWFTEQGIDLDSDPPWGWQARTPQTGSP
jgi:hypothetical protein